MLKMLYEKAAQFGHTEVSRHRNPDDTVGPLNQRLNACGAALREFSQREFPFPDATQFGTRTGRIGSRRKEFRVAGYEGSSFGPRVMLAHPDLPSMDFGDAARSHSEYLAAYCTICDVPVSETTKYCNLLFLLVRPYLEYIYSEYKCGRPEFRKGTNAALRRVKQLISESGYHPTMQAAKSLTGDLEQATSIVVSDFFRSQLNEASMFYGSHPALQELERLTQRGFIRTPGLEEPCLTKDDVECIRQQAINRAKLKGSIMHRRISDLFPSPWHLNDVIFNGHRYVGASGYAIVSEIPLVTESGLGKVDILLLEKIITADGKQTLWRPAFVCEIKTRMGHQWHIDAEEKSSESRLYRGLPPRVVAEISTEDRALEDREWDAIVKSAPSASAQKQVQVYAQALAQRYYEATGLESGYVLRGTIVIESITDINEARRTIEGLLVKAYESIRNMSGAVERTVISPSGGSNGRVALVIHEQVVPEKQRGEVIDVSWNPLYNPFRQSQESRRRFILCLAGRSPTSAGQSAAWIARNYHGLQMLYEMRESHSNAQFVWFDLASQFAEPRLAEARFRLRPRGYSDDEVAKAQPDHIREFFEGIEVRGRLDEVLSYLYEGGNIPSFELDMSVNGRSTVIVTGADTLRDATPESHRDRLQVVLDRLLDSLPGNKKTTVLWFDAPTPSSEKSVAYATRALLPFYDNSSLAEVVTEIVWNLPVAPRNAVEPEKCGLPVIGDSPMHDDIRVIVRHSPEDMNTELVLVPPLRGWSRRFKNQGKGLIVQERGLQDAVPDKATRSRIRLLSMTMLPWLVRLWPDKMLSDDSKETIKERFDALMHEFRGAPEDLTFEVRVLDGPPGRTPSVLDLMRYRHPETGAGKAYVAKTLGRVNSQRLYRSPNRLRTRPRTIVAPPLEMEDFVASSERATGGLTYGIKFMPESDTALPWWLVMQDPRNEARMLIGCFVSKSPDREGFLWSDTKQEILTQQTPDEILGYSQVLIECRQTEQGLETWSLGPDGHERVYSGVLEVVEQGHSSVSHLRAIRQTHIEPSVTEPSQGANPPESFYQRVAASLRRYIEAVERPTRVNVRLQMVNDVCQVRFVGGDDEVLQEVIVEYTAELISLLRWPMARPGPMHTDSGTYVTWSVFDDIEYGELDFIGPYVTLKAARSEVEELPIRVSGFFEEAETLKVSIEHDQLVCPIPLGEEPDHGACWRISLPPDCCDRVERQLGRTMNGEAVNGLLAPGRIYAGRLYKLVLVMPEVSSEDERVVFHEDRYIRMLLRRNGLTLRPLEPGTYLRVGEQTWMVDLSCTEPEYVRWRAQSTVSGLFLTETPQTIELAHGHGAKKECQRILSIITSRIPKSAIQEYDALREHVLSELKRNGYSKTRSPPCEIRLSEVSETSVTYSVFPVELGVGESLLSRTIDLESEKDARDVIDMIQESLTEGEMSRISIRNRQQFIREVTSWLGRARTHLRDDDEEVSEGPVKWTVTLYVQDQAIHWESRETDGTGTVSGLLYDDPKNLFGGGVQQAVRRVREAVELGTIAPFQTIDNLDDVLRKQVPDVVRDIRRAHEQGAASGNHE